MLNKVQLIGNLTKDPEPKITNSGSMVLSFTLAVNEVYKDREGNKQQKTEFIECVVWNKLAEIIVQYCTKGQMLYVEGKYETSSWKNDQGETRTRVKINVRDMKMFPKSPQNQEGAQGAPTYQQAPQQQQVAQSGHVSVGPRGAYQTQGDVHIDNVPF